MKPNFVIPKYRKGHKVADKSGQIWHVISLQPLRDTYLYVLESEDKLRQTTEPEYNLNKHHD